MCVVVFVLIFPLIHYSRFPKLCHTRGSSQLVKIVCRVTDKSAASCQQVVVMEFGQTTRHNGLLPAPTCYGFAVGKLRGHWYNGFWLYWHPSRGQWGSCVDAHTVTCFMTGQRRLPSPMQWIDGICSLFLSLPWSASLSVERWELFALTTISWHKVCENQRILYY